MTGVVSGSALVVEDEPLIAMELEDALVDMGLTVCGIASTAHRAIALALEHRPQLVLMDVRLEGEPDGISAAQEIHRHMDAKVIFATGSREEETVARIREDCPAAILFKPFLTEDLQRIVRDLLD